MQMNSEYEVHALPRDDDADQTLDTRKMAHALWRGKFLLVVLACAGFLLGFAHISRQEPVYLAVSSILYEPERLQIVDIWEVIAEQDTPAGMGNQIEIFNSTILLENVAKSLSIASLTQDGTDASAANLPLQDNAFTTVQDWMPEQISNLLQPLGIGKQAQATEVAPPVDAEKAQEAYIRDTINHLRDNLNVQQVSGSGVIELVYSSSDPDMAAHVVNTISEEYIAFQQVSKNKDVLTAIDMVNTRIVELRKVVASSEGNLKETRLELTQQRGQSADMVRIQLLALNQELAEIRLRLAASNGRYERAAKALSEGTDLWGIKEFRESELITRFRTREIEIREKIAQERAISGNIVTPSSVRNAALLKETQGSIREEAAYIIAALEFEVTSLKQSESHLDKLAQKLELTSIELKAEELYISGLEREVTANQTLLQTFIVRQKEISEQSNLQSADARILSRADPPPIPDRAVSNRTLLASGGGAFIIGAIFLLLRERLNNSLRDPRDLADVTPMPILTSLPLVGKRYSLQARARDFQTRPKCLFAESVRNLRTSILYSDPAHRPRVVMITSSVPGEGKSVTSFLTALASQYTEHNAILVSCDLRDKSNMRHYSSFPSVTGAKSRDGLLGYLRKDCTLESALAMDTESGLDILALGKYENLTESPADLLSSPRFAEMIDTLRETYSLVILDAPPVLVAADAKLLARLSDSIVYLVRWNHTSKNAVREGLRELRSIGGPVIGCVLTMVSQSKARKYADNDSYYKQRFAAYYK